MAMMDDKAVLLGVGKLVTANVEDFARFAPEIEVIGLATLTER